MEPVLIAGQWQPSRQCVGTFRAHDPATGNLIGPEFPISGKEDIECAVSAAAMAAAALAACPVERIADFLDRYAKGIEANAEQLATTAHAETALPLSPRLSDVELPRTCDQLRQAAQAVRSYAWTNPVIDTHNGLRSHYAPLCKPVLVMGPNNFPFAFNAIAGSDFASAIAARNPVIAKAHPSHPATSQLLATIAHKALLETGLPVAAVQLLYDFDSTLGIALASDRRIGAIGFTGSRTSGLSLKDAADRTGVPIYAEMSSVNPVFLLPGALAERSASLAQEFFASCTMGSGQFCTNPGVIMVPTGYAGDDFVEKARSHFSDASAMVLFSSHGQQHLAEAVGALCAAGAEVLAGTATASGPGYRYTPTLLTVHARTFLNNARALQVEAFGPVALIVRVDDEDDMVAVATTFDGNLTGTLHTAESGTDDPLWRRVVEVLRPRIGRLILNKWPTGVAVSPAMQHGGPYPSTGHPGFTSVGMPAAIRRFAALHSYDQVLQSHLPTELRDANPQRLWRQIDGAWSQE